MRTTLPALLIPSLSVLVQRSAPPVARVQGGSRRTWSYGSHPGRQEQVHFEVGSDGRPVNTEFELWQGPGNTPVQSRIYGDDGYTRPVYATVGTGGRGGWGTNTASVRNQGPLEFPINANVGVGPHPSAFQQGAVQRQRIQGEGSLRTFTIDGSIGSVVVNLQSEGMPIYAKIEILQGPNSDRQGIELYSDDGRSKPVSYLLELPGYGSTISITNTGPMVYPLTASVVPYGPQRMEPDDHGYGAGAYGGMMQDRAARYGRGDGQNGQNGQKWFERGRWGSSGAPRGPPPSFAETLAEVHDMQMDMDMEDAGYGGMVQPMYGGANNGGPRQRHLVHAGAQYGSSVY